MKRFYELGQSIYFWLAGIAYLLVMEAIALYYQYVLNFFPCALCVQVRAWVVGAIISSAISVYFRSNFWVRFVGLTVTIFFIGGGLYTSWYAWGVENGTVISTCSIGAGFPTFMPLDEWIPFFFGANGPCGQSPEMWFGLSMVETLLITLGIPMILLVAQWLMHLPHALVSTYRFAIS
ncbi:MAG: disulfide bond formation protein B [Pseudomonadales bacterium]|nr:disulfide bond formation protein B [Pseudomonadales bacterium]